MAEENVGIVEDMAKTETTEAVVENESGEWICVKCGNSNFAHRTVCNMRKCREPRYPSASRKRGADGAEQSDSGKRGKAGENWNCKKCGNENFASRTVCNMRKCREPREEWLCPACGNLNFKHRTVCNMRKCNAPRPMSTMQSMLPVSGMASSRGFPQGYDMTAYANAYQMGAAGDQAALDAYGYPQFLMGQNPYMGFPMGQQQQSSGGSGGKRNGTERKEGDWQCSKCGNFNYASRNKCNMRNCQEPRKDQ